MNQVDRQVRAAVYALFRNGVRSVREVDVADVLGMTPVAVSESLRRLHEGHGLVLSGDGSVMMAHPFSGVDTGHTATMGDITHRANCAWDALAILALLGDGVARCPGGPEWTVDDGVVSPEGVVHLLVPAARFWDDVVFT